MRRTCVNEHKSRPRFPQTIWGPSPASHDRTETKAGAIAVAEWFQARRSRDSFHERQNMEEILNAGGQTGQEATKKGGRNFSSSPPAFFYFGAPCVTERNRGESHSKLPDRLYPGKFKRQPFCGSMPSAAHPPLGPITSSCAQPLRTEPKNRPPPKPRGSSYPGTREHRPRNRERWCFPDRLCRIPGNPPGQRAQPLPQRPWPSHRKIP